MAFKHFWVQYKLGSVADQAYIKADNFVIGRAPECDLPIPTDILSRQHLKVYLEGDKIFVKDLGSTNGTYLQGQKLESNEKYEYKTGNRLYLDAGKECSLRITPIFQRDIVDLDIEKKGLELEKKRRELRSKGNISRNLRGSGGSENFVANASESVDNIFENLIYVAKSARFNKEKKIREAEYISQEMIEKAQNEIETQRALLEKELKALQIQTRNEANRLIKAANDKGADHIKKVEAKARQLRSEAQQIRDEAAAKAAEAKQEIIDRAQEKHAKIIADAYLKNQELKEENNKIDKSLKESREQREVIEKEIKILKKTYKEQEELTIQTKETYSHELSHLNSIKVKVLNMEKRNTESLEVLGTKIPELEMKLSRLDQEIFDAKIEIKKKETEIENAERKFLEQKEELEKNARKTTASEKRLDELSSKIIEAEDNLFRLNKIKQQRNEEVDREIEERKRRQKANEDRANEKLARKKEKIEREIEVNLANAKEKAFSLIEKAKAEGASLIETRNQELSAKESAIDEKCEALMQEARSESEKLIVQTKLSQSELQSKIDKELKEAKHESQLLKSQAKQYYDQLKSEADSYSIDVREKADIDVSSRRKNLELEIQESKDRLLADSRLEAKEIREKSRIEAEAIIAEANEKAEKIMTNVQEQADQDLDVLQKDIEKRKKETEEEIQSIRSHAVQKMEEQRQLYEKEEEERNRIRVLKLRKDLNEVVRARIIPFLKDAGHIDKVSQVVNKSISAILLDEVDDEMFGSENYSDIDPSMHQDRVKKFYGGAFCGVLLLILIFVFAPDIKKMAKDSSRNIAQEMEEQDQAQMEKIQKENDLSAAFNPDMKDDYFDSYAERIMYTKGYFKLETDPGFKQQWRIELETFFVDQLRLTEPDMVPFLARETALLKELNEARSKINGNFVDEGRQRLKEIEDNFFKRIKAGGLKEKQIKKIMDFKKKFFEENKELFSG